MKFEEVIDKKIINEKIQGDVLEIHNKISGGKKLYIESYGCQMNFSDSEIVASILTKEGYSITNTIENSDLILINTCSIREKAEETIRNRLRNINVIKKKRAFALFKFLVSFYQ